VDGEAFVGMITASVCITVRSGFVISLSVLLHEQSAVIFLLDEVIVSWSLVMDK
jgi:hypothetical protein